MTLLSHRSTLALLAVSSVGAAIVVGHEGSRVLQLLVLALTAWVWLWWPSRSVWVRGIQGAIAVVVGISFIVDGAVRGFIHHSYQAGPNSSLVMSAVANTTPQESAEFLMMHGPSLSLWALLTLAGLAALSIVVWSWWRQPPPPPKVSGWSAAVIALVLIVLLMALASKPWRKHHPLVFWSDWVTEVGELRAQWTDLGEQRAQLLMNARQAAPAATPSSPSTMVLVISESINRGHLSLYGYARDTTPQLKARQQSDPTRFGKFSHAWSVDASTIPALRNFFYFGQAGRERQHLLALAASGGYRTWWISNHDDLAVDQEHALLADRVHMLNKTPGRSSVSLDHDTLPTLEQALKDPAPRKLIVVHLLGAHPHYELRYPPGQATFDGAKDDVYQSMKNQGRSFWARELRNEYDSALRYHDSVVSATLDLTRQASDNAVWVYFSDHGQEVGSQSDHAGHSAATADGYRIPLLLWGSPVTSITPKVKNEPVRTDWLAYTVMRLLGLEWQGHTPERDVLDPRYQWIAPDLPALVDFKS